MNGKWRWGMKMEMWNGADDGGLGVWTSHCAKALACRVSWKSSF